MKEKIKGKVKINYFEKLKLITRPENNTKQNQTKSPQPDQDTEGKNTSASYLEQNQREILLFKLAFKHQTKTKHELRQEDPSI